MSSNKTRLWIGVALLSAVWQPNVFGQALPTPVSTPVDQQAAAAIRTYWTPERLQSAIPMDLPARDVNNLPPQAAPPVAPGSAGFTPAQAPGAGRGRAPVQPPAAPRAEPLSVFQEFYPYPEPFTRHDVPRVLYDESLQFPQFPYSTIGKLFFTIPGQGDFVCSASAVRPHLLLTARHCVYNGQFFTNHLFFPSYHAGANVSLSPLALGGGWPARALQTWSCPCNPDAFDIGFIQTFDDDGVGCGGSAGGLPIEAYIGLLGLAWAGNAGNEPVQHYNAMGYPQAAPFSGNWMVVSEASTADFDLFGVNDTISIGSDQTGGSSGGPWILGFDPGSNPGGFPGTNQVNGLNSFQWTVPARPLEINGPQFKDYNFNQLRLPAEGLPCP